MFLLRDHFSLKLLKKQNPLLIGKNYADSLRQIALKKQTHSPVTVPNSQVVRGMVEKTANLDRLVSLYHQSDVHTLEMFIPRKFQLLLFCKSNVYCILPRRLCRQET